MNFYSLTDLAVVRMSGADAAQFLQGQLTCDVRSLTPGRWQAAALCNAQGRVLATLRLGQCVTGQYWALIQRELAETVVQRLQRYRLRSQVDFALARGQLFGLLGEDCAAALASLDLQREPGNDTAINTAGLWAWYDEGGAQPRAWLWAPQDWTPPAPLATDSAWQVSEIQRPWPAIGAALSEQFVPQMLNLDQLGAISLNKGCYTGQEVVARAHYLGQVKRRLFGYASAGAAPAAGASLTSDTGQAVGVVVSSAALADGGCVMLAVVNQDQAETTLYCADQRLTRLA